MVDQKDHIKALILKEETINSMENMVDMVVMDIIMEERCILNIPPTI